MAEAMAGGDGSAVFTVGANGCIPVAQIRAKFPRLHALAVFGRLAERGVGLPDCGVPATAFREAVQHIAAIAAAEWRTPFGEAGPEVREQVERMVGR
jgi:hypothetical protein